jgi:glycosyltransferase involved in cell wall biosynthesis
MTTPTPGDRQSACRATIVVPCFNEAARLPAEAFAAFTADNPAIRFLFVNDGSTDGTLGVLRTLEAASAGQIAVLDVQPNGGKAEAVRRGVLKALEDGPTYVGYLDADLSTPLEAVPQLLGAFAQRPQIEAVLGTRVRLLGRRIERRPLRHYCGRVFATFASWVLQLPVYDTQCGAKLFRASPAVSELFAEPFRSRWIFDVEILARMRRRARRGEGPWPEHAVYESPLDRWRDVAGSKVRPKDFLRAIVELWNIHRSYSKARDLAAGRCATRPDNDSRPGENHAQPVDDRLKGVQQAAR